MVLGRLCRGLILLVALSLLPGCSLLTDLDELRGTGAVDGATADLARDRGPGPDQKLDTTGDLPRLDGPVADRTPPDKTPPDTALPLDGTKLPDLVALPDLTPPPDLAPPPDLTPPPDNTMPPDQAPLTDKALSQDKLQDLALPDLAPSPDIASPPDLAPSPDLAPPPDFAPPPDVAPPPDFAPPLDNKLPADMPAKLATVVVAASGLDTATCGSATSPCLSVNHATGRAMAGGTVLVRNGKYDKTSQTFPIYLEKSVTIKGEGGASLVSFVGAGPLVRCGTSGEDVSGAKMEGILLHESAGTQPAIVCADVTGTPSFVGITVNNQGIVLNKADAVLNKVTCNAMLTGAHCLVVDNTPPGKTPKVRNSNLGSNSAKSICVHVKANGRVDLGTKAEAGGNDLKKCDFVSICNETTGKVYAVGNSWPFGPLMQGNSCSGAWPIGNTQAGGSVVTN